MFRGLLFTLAGFIVVGWVFYNIGYCRANPGNDFNNCVIKRISFGLLDSEQLSSPPPEL